MIHIQFLQRCPKIKYVQSDPNSASQSDPLSLFPRLGFITMSGAAFVYHCPQSVMAGSDPITCQVPYALSAWFIKMSLCLKSLRGAETFPTTVNILTPYIVWTGTLSELQLNFLCWPKLTLFIPFALPARLKNIYVNDDTCYKLTKRVATCVILYTTIDIQWYIYD